jgi:hypothetical protein
LLKEQGAVAARKIKGLQTILARERSKRDKEPAPPKSPQPVGRSPRAAHAQAAQD